MADKKLGRVLLELDGELIPMNELEKKDYEDFLEFMNQLRLAYIAVVSKRN